uniref:Uncharacterized protein TCIL3000_11_890 n=1 Tax=Trypanosoma congolense (strain IL3000) TaxID=1068625 RepID=G0UZ88_TRYCI|nr:unnamed protein product [Trypanosoma congolense IL3000]
MPYYQQRVAVGLPTVSVASAVRSNPTPLSVVAFSSAELRDLLNSSKVNLGVSEEREGIEAEKESPALPGSEKTPTREVAVFVPLCSRDDYILEPPLVVLRELTVQQLRDVYGFSVYRRDGKCSIRFLEPVNLVRCDIAEVVDLSPSGEVKLYPGVLTPPPLGYGLRVRARVTVNGVVNTTSSELRLRCQKEGSRFESYDSETGAWVYTINEEGEQEDYDDDGDREVDIVEAEERMQAEEDVSAVSDAPESTISSPARRDPDVRTQRAQPLTSMTPVPLEPHQSISFPQSNIPSSLPLPRHSTRGGEQSLMLPQRTDRVFLLREDGHLPSSGKSAESVDFQLPYPLPEVKEEPLCERRGVFVVKEHHRKPPGVVYVVRKEDSRIYEMSASIVSRGTMASLGRSFRCGWCIGGRLVAPTFAWLRDGTEARRPVDEVSGSGVTMSTPYFAHATSKHYLQSCAISVLRTMCRYLRRTDVSVNEEGCFPLLSVNLCRGGGVSSLSTERLREVVAAIDAVRFERNTAVGESTARQAKTVLRLFDALYGLPDADEAEKNAITEKRYLTQLRRRNLNSWLRTELEFMDSWSDSDVDINPSQQLLRKLLCGKQREASTVAKAMGSTELSRILGVCGEGNQFGRYVQTSDTHKIDEASGVRQRVISLLSGVVEPFVSQPQYKQSDDGSGNGLIASVPLAATWKQLLGIFAFYGCAPDTPAEETIDNFLSRLRAPTSRRENPFPPYADRISDDILETNRGRSFLARGGEFPDASLSILEGFAAGVAPKASALHPHSSSYCATDYLTPFIIIVVVRALRLQCTEVYCDAETKALLGFAATLECLSDSWFWALLPLHMILDAKCRAVAVEQFLRRHAHRFQGGMSKNNAEFTQLVELMKLRLQLLEVEQLPEEIPIKMPTNAPSIRTHSSLQEALHRFSRDFMRK